ncbi:MAG: hypothetical protein K1X53_18100 [Candidatus Sumerlaeaceae bacterium]|nr:hypothetical protein [Candidatus Sumerlaeaceae bacterium]
MPRFARVIVVGEPYHITHRGNRRARVFFTDEDREVYMAMLARDLSPPRKRGRPRKPAEEPDCTEDLFS